MVLGVPLLVLLFLKYPVIMRVLPFVLAALIAVCACICIDAAIEAVRAGRSASPDSERDENQR